MQKEQGQEAKSVEHGDKVVDKVESEDVIFDPVGKKGVVEEAHQVAQLEEGQDKEELALLAMKVIAVRCPRQLLPGSDLAEKSHIQAPHQNEKQEEEAANHR